MSRTDRSAGLIALGLAGVLGVLLTGVVSASMPSVEDASQRQGAPAPSADAAKPDQSPMMAGQGMAAMREQMMHDNQAADARLQPLLERMNRAKGQAKVNAMAAVLNELAQQRAAARGQMEHMSEMMPAMMKGMTADMQKMAEQCPMMKGHGETAKP